jgi:CubicO group peptidase (beta-lactamase class C family)
MKAIMRALLLNMAVAVSFVQAQPAPLREPIKAAAPHEARLKESERFSGKWSGTLQIPGPNGRTRTLPIYLVLKQNGATVAGCGRPNLGELVELTNGKVEGDQVRFDLHAGEAVLCASLIRQADRLVGDLSSPGKPAYRLAVERVSYPTAAQLQTPLAEIDAMVSAELDKRPIGSVTIGIVSGPQLIWSKSYGNADQEKPALANENTVYRIGSITKTFTAALLYQLVQAGTVHLSDPVEKCFPEVKKIQGRYPDAPPITLVQLATHTAGLSGEPDDLPTYLKGPVSEWEKVLIAALPQTRYEFEPGTRHSYSNIGYAILGAALARACGVTYVEAVQKRIFQPLGMEHTSFEPNSNLRQNLSKGYAVQGKEVDSETPQREHEGRGYKVPNGAIYTTVGDLGRFASFLLGEGLETVLKAISLERYLHQQPVQADIELSRGYGQGFKVIRREHFTAVGHTGGVAGYQAALYLDRKAGVAAVVLANVIGTSVSTDDLALRSLDIVAKGKAKSSLTTDEHR